MCLNIAKPSGTRTFSCYHYGAPGIITITAVLRLVNIKKVSCVVRIVKAFFFLC